MGRGKELLGAPVGDAPEKARKPRLALAFIDGAAATSILSIALDAIIWHVRLGEPLIVARAAGFPSGHQLMQELPSEWHVLPGEPP